MQNKKILIYGYGNPGRQDDGLGNAFIEKLDKYLKEENITNIETDSNYQLNIEDAANIADKDIVIFVDASIENIESHCLTVVEPSSAQVEFTMHAVTPAFVLNLCNDIYYKSPETYLLHIKGYEWEMKEQLTENAVKNLEKAFLFIKEIIKTPSILKDFC